MNISNQKLLGLFIAASLLSVPSFMVQAADTITTQSEADAQLNSPLQSGDTTFASANTYSIPKFSQIRGTEPLSIHGNSNGTTGLNLNGSYGGSNLEDRTFSNAESIENGTGISFADLKFLSMTMTGGISEEGDHNQWNANLYAANQGQITIDSSVQNLKARSESIVQFGGDATKANILAENGGSIKVNSPNVDLTMVDYRDNHSSRYAGVRAAGDQASVQLGDDDHILNHVTLNNYVPASPSSPATRGAAIFARANGSSDAESSTNISIVSKDLSLSNWIAGIQAQGISNKPQKHVVIQVGSEEHPMDHILIDKCSTYGVSASDNGEINLYGKVINLTNSGIIISRAGHVTISAGSGEDEGLIIHGPGSRTNLTAGLLSGMGNESSIDVVKGNLSISDFYAGVMFDGTNSSYSNTINLGTSDAPLNHITMKNIGTAGIYDRDVSGGTINVYANTLAINDHVSVPIAVSSRTGVRVHTHDMTVLEGTIGKAIQNYGSFVEVNTDEAHDGALQMVGLVETKGVHYDATTKIGLHDNRSHFFGSVHDIEQSHNAKTTISISNGAVWDLDSSNEWNSFSGPSGTYNTLMDTLNLSHGGIVNLGGSGEVSGNHYAKMQMTNLTGDGGTLVFRTNLQESADTRTVNDHSDQVLIARGAADIRNSTSSGTHDIMVNDYSKTLGQAARAGYVLLVKDQSTSAGAVFNGHANLQNGGLFAKAVEITNENPDASLGYTDVPTTGINWYLRMTDRDVPVTPSKPTWNAKNNITFARSRYGALWIEQDTLRQRVGELRNHTQDDGVWARIDRGEYSMNGVNGSADYIRYHIGYDKQVGSQKGQKQYIGMAYHHTDTDLNYRHFTDDSDMDADIGTIYYTNLQDKGHYLDIVGKFGRMKGKMKTFGDFPESAKWDSPFYSLSAEYGRKVMYKNDWYMEPQAQLTYSHLGSDSYLTSQGTHAHVDGINSLIFRTGFTVGKKDGQNEYYGKVFWHHEFEGAEDARFHDKNDDSLRDSYDFGGSWVTVGFGGQVGIGKDAYVYGDIDKSFGGDVKKKWAWNMGVRFGF